MKMHFDEFESHAHQFMRLITEAYHTVHLLGYEFNKEVEFRTRILELQRNAGVEFDRISHIADIACNRTKVFGAGKDQVDIFKAALAVADTGGSGIIEDAVSEMGMLVTRLRKATKKNPDASVEALAERISTPAFPRDEQAISQTVAIAKGLSTMLKESDYESNVFIMMRLRDARQHREIAQTLKASLGTIGMRGHLASDKNYSDDLWDNVRVFMHGCKYGIAVFEEIDEREFNPNISLELGYMYASGKSCLVLKDKRMPRLPTDICGKIYADFDTYNVEGTVSNCVNKWAGDIGISSAPT